MNGPYTTIISTAQLAELRTRTAPGELVLFDARFSLADPAVGSRAYADAHIPGALYLHLDEQLSSPTGPDTGRHPLPTIEAFSEVMREHGVSADTQVVVYDDAGGMFASRTWWLLQWLGHQRVAVLDGGLPAWLRAGGAVEPNPTAKPPRGQFEPRPRPEMLVLVDRLQSHLAQDEIILCDARAPERYRGDVEPIDKVAGHVPGAINLPFSQNLNAEGCFLPAAEIRQRFQSAAAAEVKPMVHMCGSGVTACHNVLASAVAGLPMPALYAGSWSEWITDPTRPTAKTPI